MKKRQAVKGHNPISTNMKMECQTFDLDPVNSGCAERCNFGTVENQFKGSCYVLNNPNERWDSRKKKLEKNLDLINSKKFVSVMTYEIKRLRTIDFRWFSAGDFPNLESVKKIFAVCENLPRVRFWLPTSRDDFLYQIFEVEGIKKPENLTIRYSSPTPLMPVPEPIKKIFSKHGINFSSTTDNAENANCQSSKDGLSCGTCDLCFDESKPEIVYLIHGRTGRKNLKK